jgi:tRNA dimethylallyltransferase
VERALSGIPQPSDASAPVLVIIGPTGSGKTAISVALAEAFQGEIVNCDSVAIYRELNAGTAKPGAEDRRRAPHHLFDLLSPSETITAGAYARLARQTLAEIKDRGRLPIVVGGTGLYLRALLEGLFRGPERFQPLRERLRARALSRGSPYLHRMLQRLDPVAAEKIHAHDASKLVRALEVCLAARRPMSELWQRGRDPLRGFLPLKIGLDPPRAQLYARLNRRALRMFDAGLVEETRRLLQLYPGAWPLSAHGYRHCAHLVRGEWTLQQAVAAVQQAHRNYAKRQMTWFRREPEVRWLHGFGDDPVIQQQAFFLLRDFLARLPSRIPEGTGLPV